MTDMTPTDQLATLALTRQLALERLNAGYLREQNALFADIAAELNDLLKSGKELTEYQGRRLEAKIASLAAAVIIPAPDITDLPAIEAQWAQAGLASIGLDAALPTAQSLASIATATLVQGATTSAWFSKLEADTRFAITRAARNGVALGLTNAQIARDMIGIVSEGDKGDEALKVARRSAISITRTAVQTVANQARLATYEENADILSGIEWSSTLDSRVSDTCKALDGKVWTLPNYTPKGHSVAWLGGPPAHFQCRSSIIPVTKTFRELGLDADEIPEGTRASQYGQVSQGTDMAAWLRSQPRDLVDDTLGKGRADLFLSGKITLTQLISPTTLKPLTLAELRAL